MERKCTNCNTEMKKVALYSGGGYALLKEEEKGFFKNKVCNINTYVCPKCGHIELFADQLEIIEE